LRADAAEVEDEDEDDHHSVSDTDDVGDDADEGEEEEDEAASLAMAVAENEVEGSAPQQRGSMSPESRARAASSTTVFICSRSIGDTGAFWARKSSNASDGNSPARICRCIEHDGTGNTMTHKTDRNDIIALL
jgi:hypothetical protein